MQVRAKKIDATKGAIVPLIISFVIPLILTTVLQKFFNAVDLAVLGNMADTNAVASVGATTTIIHLMVDAFVGISAGAKIVFSRLFGRADNAQIKRTAGTSMIVALGFGIIIATVGFIFAPTFLGWVKCPPVCLKGAILYTRIYVLSAPAILIYNYGAAVLTSSGDSRRPMNYAIFSGLLNAVLNVVLCLILTEKVAAVAIATAASQLLAATLVILRLTRLEGELKLEITRMRFDPHAFSQLMRFGIPMALQVLVYPLANVQIAAAINSYGEICVAGNSAALTMHDIVSAFRVAFGTAVATFMGQNLGAGNHERVKASLLHNTWMSIAVCLPLSLLEWALAPFWLKLFLGQDAAAAEFALIRVAILNSSMFFLLMNTILGHAIQAFGYPIFSTVNAVVWVLGFRIFWMSLVYPVYTSYASLMVCFSVSYVLNFICNVIIFAIIYYRYRKRKYKHIR